MHILNQYKAICFKSKKFYNRKKRSSDWIVISRDEYRRLNVFQGLMLFILLAFLPGLVFAGVQSIPDDIKAGSLFLKDDSGVTQQAVRMESEVDFEISGMVSRVSVKQHFKNNSPHWMEGVYVFPLPDKSAVDQLRIHVGERIIEGVIKEKQQARKIYQKARASGKRSALIEQERPNLFTTSVANIGPDETVVVEITYQQVLEYKNGRFSMRFPMTITPRYIPGQAMVDSQEQVSVTGSGWSVNTSQVADASRITPPMKTEKNGRNNEIKITANLDAGFPLMKVNSLYHDIQMERLDNIYHIKLQNIKVIMDRDFELSWQPAIGSEPSAAFFKESIDGEDYALIMLMPPQINPALAEIQSTLPREVIFIIDTSGSMAGQSLRQAKQALIMALNTLTINDRFNIIEFNSVTRELFSGAILADSQSLRAAVQYVKNLNADGGTEMMPAIEAALDDEALENYVRQIIFMTDGSVGNEKELFKLIEDKLKNSRLFTVGIGSAPNSYFMRKAAQFGRGTYTFISSVDDISSRMQELFLKLQSPVLTDLKLNWSGSVEPEVWPRRMPDLYNKEPLIITAKLDSLNKNLQLKGKALGEEWQREISLEKDIMRSGIASLWARNMIEDLMDKKISNSEPEDIKKQIIDIAIKHHLVSQYTSLVAVDLLQVRAREDELFKTNVANNMPYDSTQTHGFPQAATPARINFLLGLLAVLFILTIILAKKHYEI
jgi:Ca-activated chloride channel homolog